MIISALLFIIGLLLLLKGADFFVEGGGGLAKRYGVSPATIGFTVIAFGTSLPEFVVSINAIASDNAGVALGNVLGSNIANIALVLAICAIIRPTLFARGYEAQKYPRGELGLMFVATLLFIVLSLRGVLDFFSGLVFLIAFVLILKTLWKSESNGPEDEDIECHGNIDYIYTIGGLVAVAAGSQLVLDGAVTIAEALNIPSFVIGMSMVAVGTSLPELATSLVAILKGNGGISIGNILGSNIFNLLFVMGCGTLIRPVAISSMTDILVVGGFSLAILPLFMKKPEYTRGWAVCLLAGYIIYIGVLFGIV